MARYIDADELIKVIAREANFQLRTPDKDGEARGLVMAMKTIKKFPTADVAPRAELAREIFEEIENAYCYWGNRYNGWAEFGKKIAELKKKYTEEHHEPQENT